MRLVWGKRRRQVTWELGTASDHTNDLDRVHCKRECQWVIIFTGIRWEPKAKGRISCSANLELTFWRISLAFLCIALSLYYKCHKRWSLKLFLFLAISDIPKIIARFQSNSREKRKLRNGDFFLQINSFSSAWRVRTFKSWATREKHKNCLFKVAGKLGVILCQTKRTIILKSLFFACSSSFD